jgi:hypothetical protein
MQDIGGQGHTNKGESEPQNILTATTSQQKQPNQDGSSHAEETGNENKGSRHYFRELLNEGPDRHIELLLTIAIATFALFQLLITCSNNASTSQQTQRLLDSANRINDAADSFSKSSADIGRGMSDAVGKLNLQAQKLDASVQQASRLAGDTEKANQNVIDADRPWMGGAIGVFRL